jgi:hypothetical protein
MKKRRAYGDNQSVSSITVESSSLARARIATAKELVACQINGPGFFQ